MNLQQLKGGTVPEKKWLDIVAYDIKCNSIIPVVPIPPGPPVVPSKIESADLSSSITANNVGIGGGGLDLIGSQLDMNGALFRNPGLIDTSSATLNIITPTTQISQGISAWDLSINSLPRITQNAIKSKLECGTSRLQLAALSDLLSDDTSTYLAAQNVALTKNMAVAVAPDQLYINQDGAINRMVVDDSKTALYSKNWQSGPAGSLLELNNDNTFTLGAYNANNGIIECRPNSLAIVGNAANSSYVMTGSNIITALSNGSGRIDREIMDTGGQVWYDPTGTERLRLSTSGISIGGLYTLPTTTGLIGQVLTKDGFLGTTSWQSPQIVGLYSATGAPITVAGTIAQLSLVPSGVGSLTVPAGFFTPGMSFQLSCGGTFRDNVNNTPITFRLTNSGTLFSTGIITLSNVPLATTAWSVSTQFTYIGGTQLITNFTFSYGTSGSSNMFGYTAQQVNNTFNPLVSNTLDFTVQWGANSVNNTITCNYFTLTKLY
jgi:hypothetical protein